MTAQAATVQLSPPAPGPFLEEVVETVPSQVRPDGYQVVERTLHVPGGLTPAHLRELSALLGRRPLAAPPYRTELRTELTGAAGDEDALAYLREQRLAHTVTDRLRWRPGR